MARKLYALLILIGVIGAMVLGYLYFFVYYTATLSINANEDGYEVEFFSKSTAQKRRETCPERECIITDVSPFEYNVSISKEGYDTITMSIDVAPRRQESLFVELQKQVTLTPVATIQISETPKQKIERLREENRSLLRLQIDKETSLRFEENAQNLKMFFQNTRQTQLISEFPLVPASEIIADTMSGSNDIFLKIGEDSYIFETQKGKLTELYFEIDILYIKSARTIGEYIIITEKGAFLYDTSSRTPEFQYLFQDYLYIDNALIGVVREDEVQKRKNFNLPESGNLIIKYTPSDKTRNILYQSSEKIERIEWKNDQIILTVSGSQYELKNY